MNNKEFPEVRRERLRQLERKKNPSGNLHDAINRSILGDLVDLVGKLSWKGTAIVIILLVLGFFIYMIIIAI